MICQKYNLRLTDVSADDVGLDGEDSTWFRQAHRLKEFRVQVVMVGKERSIWNLAGVSVEYGESNNPLIVPDTVINGV